jgi:hypothetical protein
LEAPLAREQVTVLPQDDDRSAIAAPDGERAHVRVLFDWHTDDGLRTLEVLGEPTEAVGPQVGGA